MPYHINDEGNVGECDASIRCPFGDFESEHYTTREEAQRAYEAAMRGETFKRGPGGVEVALAEDPVRKLSRKIQKKRNGVQEFLNSLPPLPYVSQGYYTDSAPLHHAYPGASFNGGLIADVQVVNRTKTVTVQYPTNPDAAETYTFELDEDGRIMESKDVWVDQPSVEDVAVRAAEARERNLQASLKFVCSDVKRKRLLTPYSTRYDSGGGLVITFNWSPRAKLAETLRTYQAMVEDAKRAGVANPHTFALNRYKKTIPEVRPQYEDVRDWTNAQPAFSRFVVDLLEQDPGPRSHVHKAWIQDGFDEGEQPWFDYTFDEIGSRSV